MVQEDKPYVEFYHALSAVSNATLVTTRWKKIPVRANCTVVIISEYRIECKTGEWTLENYDAVQQAAAEQNCTAFEKRIGMREPYERIFVVIPHVFFQYHMEDLRNRINTLPYWAGYGEPGNPYEEARTAFLELYEELEKMQLTYLLKPRSKRMETYHRCEAVCDQVENACQYHEKRYAAWVQFRKNHKDLNHALRCI